jgi:hypothetical protein
VSAPFAIPGRFPRRRALRFALPLLLAVLLSAVAGCSVQKPRAMLHIPDGLPASIDYLPGDSMGWVLFDAHPGTKHWAAIDTATGTEASTAVVTAFADRMLGASDVPASDVTSWAGATGGFAFVNSDVTDDDATIGFFDVSHRGALEKVLRAHDFTEHPGTNLGDGAAGNLTLWTPKSSGDQVVGVADDAAVYAPTTAGLKTILRHTHELRAIERRGATRFTVAAHQASPLALVYRGDDVRDQLLRLVASDPSKLELGRWFATTSVVSASRDGWVGLAPPLDRSRRAVRLVGAFEWAKGQSTIGEPKPVRRATLDALPSNTAAAVALTDPGSYVTDFVGAATHHGYNFATKLDIPKGDQHVNLLKLLGQYDGETALALAPSGTLSMHAHVKSVRKAISQLDAAARLFNFQDRLSAKAAGTGQVDVTYEPKPAAATKAPASGSTTNDPQRSAASDAVTSDQHLGDQPVYVAAMKAAGAPSVVPIAWLYSARSCSDAEGMAGWLTWDKDKTMRWTMDIPLGDGPTALRTCTTTALVAAGTRIPAVRRIAPIDVTIN